MTGGSSDLTGAARGSQTGEAAPVAGRVAVITLAHGRHDHLRAQIAGLRRGTARAEHYVVAAMGDQEIAGVVTHQPDQPTPAAIVTVVNLPGTSGDLPLATARNHAAAVALADGAEVLIFLDVDCIPAPDLVRSYAAACRLSLDPRTPEVVCGPVHYLGPPTAPPGYRLAELEASTPHPARPVPDAPRALADDLRLFWSLSFAMTARSWERVGGFDEGYTGYGGEDTDFAMLLGAAGGRLWWIRDAVAYHQHHDVTSPPRRHLEAIVRNSNRFHSRWGVFPMEGWLAVFEAEGLITQEGSPPRWRLRGDAHTTARRP